MRYVFLNNFRGFSETLIPLQSVNFLVGENSTGKTSFLKIVNLLSQVQFWFSPAHTLQEEAGLGSFDDMVSAWSGDRSRFQIGSIELHEAGDGVWDSLAFVFTFSERAGAPHLSRALHCRDGRLTRVVFRGNATKFKNTEVLGGPKSESLALEEFLDAAREELTVARGYTRLAEGKVLESLPLPMLIEFVRNMKGSKEIGGMPIPSIEFQGRIPFAVGDLACIGPIRARPQRFYSEAWRRFSPEGDHTPFLIKTQLLATKRAAQFARQLKAFGEASGLFETVVSRNFGDDNRSPFELLVRFKNGDINISNVGYGVPQVLPLIVEFLSRNRGGYFAVEQPEVHLHPRAQAALGEFVFSLATERRHRFVMETHSDYLIDRFRLCLSRHANPPKSQVVFFERIAAGNRATPMQINSEGRYPDDQPASFRDFFIKEEMQLLGI
ncbi:MAG: AAA family ATPase [Acidobacteria bacterium]|nr:AAA family ATPase [Acidobacteriota bacterium]